MWISVKNPDQVIWLAGHQKWAWHLNLFSMTRVNNIQWNITVIVFSFRKNIRKIFLTSHLQISSRTCLDLNSFHIFFTVLQAIREDSPTVPTLLTDYILKGNYMYMYFWDFFQKIILFFPANLVNTHWNCLIEVIPGSTYKVRFE